MRINPMCMLELMVASKENNFLSLLNNSLECIEISFTRYHDGNEMGASPHGPPGNNQVRVSWRVFCLDNFFLSWVLESSIPIWRAELSSFSTSDVLHSGSSIETQEELRHIFYSSFKSCSSRGYITKWQLRAKTFLNNVGISFATWMFTPLKLLFSAWCLQIPIGCGRVFSFELVSTSGEVNVYPNTDFCPSLGKVFLSRFLLLKSGQGACPPFCRTFFLWKGHISVSDQGVCLPLGKAGPSLEQQEATRWGHTHIHQPSKATQ